jgi:hypothetical protein
VTFVEDRTLVMGRLTGVRNRIVVNVRDDRAIRRV